uniref:Uncharacterized protein n=1 Tax=Anguilla anguilla TaxID=7936 RepID=A0A0E9WYJ8_ANGAN
MLDSSVDNRDCLSIISLLLLHHQNCILYHWKACSSPPTTMSHLQGPCTCGMSSTADHVGGVPSETAENFPVNVKQCILLLVLTLLF